jgi:predicted metal-binding protein
MKPKWHGNLVIVCEKCGKKLAKDSAAPNPAHEMKDWLKKELLARDLWGINRVVTASCLDICPEGKVAVAFVSDRPDLETWAEVVDPINERNRILQITTERARGLPRDEE